MHQTQQQAHFWYLDFEFDHPASEKKIVTDKNLVATLPKVLETHVSLVVYPYYYALYPGIADHNNDDPKDVEEDVQSGNCGNPIEDFNHRSFEIFPLTDE
jgi:hypothetical protein